MTSVTRLAALLHISSPPLCSEDASEVASLSDATSGMRDVFTALRVKNGFFAFENALLFRPLRTCGNVQGIIEWNSAEGWRAVYGSLIAGVVFFAEDIFAVQFGVSAGGVVSFNPETGALHVIAETLEEWAGAVLDEYEELTGWPVAHEWQCANGALMPGLRLLPRVPFVLGGEYDSNNLVAIGELEAMRKLGGLFQTVAGLADGEKVTLSNWIGKHSG